MQGMAVLGISRSSGDHPAVMWRPLELGMVVAKRLILKEWKSSTATSFLMWVTEMMSLLLSQTERLRSLKTCSVRTFAGVWSPFIAHSEEIKIG